MESPLSLLGAIVAGVSALVWAVLPKRRAAQKAASAPVIPDNPVPALLAQVNTLRRRLELLGLQPGNAPAEAPLVAAAISEVVEELDELAYRVGQAGAQRDRERLRVYEARLADYAGTAGALEAAYGPIVMTLTGDFARLQLRNDAARERLRLRAERLGEADPQLVERLAREDEHERLANDLLRAGLRGDLEALAGLEKRLGLVSHQTERFIETA